MVNRDTEIIVAKLEERDEFVRAELKELKELVTKGFEKVNADRDDLSERISDVEAEVRFAKRIGAPVLGIVITAINTYLNSFLRGGG